MRPEADARADENSHGDFCRLRRGVGRGFGVVDGARVARCAAALRRVDASDDGGYGGVSGRAGDGGPARGRGVDAEAGGLAAEGGPVAGVCERSGGPGAVRLGRGARCGAGVSLADARRRAERLRELFVAQCGGGRRGVARASAGAAGRRPGRLGWGRAAAGGDHRGCERGAVAAGDVFGGDRGGVGGGGLVDCFAADAFAGAADGLCGGGARRAGGGAAGVEGEGDRGAGAGL